MVSPSLTLCCAVALLCLVHGTTAAPCTSAKCNCTTVMRKGKTSRKLVDCSSRQLTDIPDGIPSDYEILNLNNNQIAKIAPGKLKNLSSLIEMYMNDNVLTAIDVGALEGLSALQKLYLSRNKMTNFPDICNNVGKALTHLGIDQNKLEDKPVPQSYANCTALLSLVLTKNKFTRLANATLAPLKLAGKLQSIKLNDVGMAGMEPGALLPLVSSLMNLDLSTNIDLPAAHVSTAFRVATFSGKFVGLTLKATGWTALPPGLLPKGHFPRLDILHLDDSQQLRTIGADALDGGSYLTQLFLKDCPIATLDRELVGLSQLKALNMQGSRLSSWTAATFGPSLKQLDLSDSAISFIGGLAGEANPLPHLDRLDDAGLRIDGNQLVCNCSLLWLTQQLKSDNLRKKFYKLKNVNCTDPAKGSSVNLVDFKPTGCINTTSTTSSDTTPSPTSTSRDTTSSDTTPSPTSTSSDTTSSDTKTSPTSTSSDTTSDDVRTTDDTTASPGDATTTGPHGGGTSQAPPALPVWGIALISVGCVALLAASAVWLTVWVRGRRRAATDQQQLEPLVGTEDSNGGCLELLKTFRGGREGHVQVPTTSECNEVDAAGC